MRIWSFAMKACINASLFPANILMNSEDAVSVPVSGSANWYEILYSFS